MGVGVLSEGGGDDTGDAAVTDADLSREEWIEERIAILVHMAGVPEEEAKVAAVRHWELWEKRERMDA